MRSNVCKIENGVKDLDAILKESEKVAVYNELDHKQTLQLRLLCEEIDGMLPKIIDDFDGKIWIEFEDGVCMIKLTVEFKDFTAEKKNDLIAIAKNKKNASVVGIVGRIRSALENFFLDEKNVQMLDMTSSSFYYATDYTGHTDYSYLWTLEQHREKAKKEKSEWDELEKSVIASVADDIVVGVKGKQADVTVIKKFA
jgi:hypothetical protein